VSRPWNSALVIKAIFSPSANALDACALLGGYLLRFRSSRQTVGGSGETDNIQPTFVTGARETPVIGPKNVTAIRPEFWRQLADGPGMTIYRAQFDFRRDLGRWPRARLWSAAGVALALNLSGCMYNQPERAPPPVVVTPIPVEPLPPPVASSGRPQPAKPAPPKAAPKAAESSPMAQTAASAPLTTPVIGQVIGMSQDDLRKTLGEPAERIDQGPGQAWIYRTPTCTVEILFFLDVTRNGYYALDRKLSVGDGPAEHACYTEIQNARQR
jgi:hypothetical protein